MFQPSAMQFSVSGQSDSASLAEILGAFSHALDLTEGQPAGHSIRAAWIGTYVALAAGLTGQALRDCTYSVLLKDLGCSSNAARVAELFLGDDRKLKHQFKLIGPEALDFLSFIETSVGVDAPPAERDAAIGNLCENAGPLLTGFIDTRCTQGATIARRLRFSQDVADGIAGLDEHWDGNGLPRNVSGTAIPLISRIALLAQVADVFFMTGGRDAAITEVTARSGTWLDPQLVDLFLDLASDATFWVDLAAPDLEQRLFALEPCATRVAVDEEYLDDIAFAFGSVIDAKSPFTGGHSERVALYASRIAEQMGLDAAACRTLRRAAVLHDVGKLGVSNRILDKPGRLDDTEWAAMRDHAALSTSILSRIGVMSDMAMIAGSHHERLDGTGYPLGLDARTIALETRIITVADIFDALTADRPYRPAMPLDKALAIMDDECGSAIDADVLVALKMVLETGMPTAPLPVVPSLLD